MHDRKVHDCNKSARLSLHNQGLILALITLHIFPKEFGKNHYENDLDLKRIAVPSINVQNVIELSKTINQNPDIICPCNGFNRIRSPYKGLTLKLVFICRISSHFITIYRMQITPIVK